MQKIDKPIIVHQTLALEGRAVDKMTSAYISVRLDETYVKLLNELRRKEEDVPTQSAMVRRLIERAAAS